MAQNLIKTNAEAVLPNRPTIVKYVAGLEGGAEMFCVPADYPLPEDGVFHAGHPVAQTKWDNRTIWELAPLGDGHYGVFDWASGDFSVGVLAHDVPCPSPDMFQGEGCVIEGAVMLIGVVNTDADDRYKGINELHNAILNSNTGIVFIGSNIVGE